MGQRGTADLHF